MKVEKIKKGFFRYKITAEEGKVLVDLNQLDPLGAASKEIMTMLAPKIQCYREVRYDKETNRLLLSPSDKSFFKSIGLL